MKEIKLIQILAISGSLRNASSNTALLRSAIGLASEGVKITLYEGLGNLPHFNPDLEGREIFSVKDIRTQLQISDGVLISSPEYAHGIPGVLKNALDWVVGSGELYRKPVALINASPRAIHAQASLKEILMTMDAHIINEASVTVPLSSNQIDESSILSDSELSGILHKAIVSFVSAIKIIAKSAL
ncbi:MAG: NADPH-dependent FMN reductase [Nostoc sp.]|uniref:NADPH-dependent FMN reductase n=1 Tax=Nostoc sp. TaxID=1180 RepID=UPI002FF6D9DA